MGRDTHKSLCVAKHLIGALLFFCLGLASTAHAQDQAIEQMLHTSWTAKDGAPLAIFALAQTPDGVLWIGSSGGLFSFDGLKFAAFNSKSGPALLSGSQIRSLFVSREGELWVFFFHGPPARIHQGSVRFYDRGDDEPIIALDDAQQDSEGTFWAVLNQKHVVHLGSDNVWHSVTDPIPGTGHISEQFIDSSDTRWVIENDLLYRRPKRQTGFIATDVHVFGLARLAEDRDHTLWVGGEEAGHAGAANLQHIDRAGHRLFAQRLNGAVSDMLVASDDSLWISKTNGELERLRVQDSGAYSSTGRPDVYELKNGIRDQGMEALLRDAAGNIWVGGMGGLDRFEHANMVPAIADSKVGIWFTCVGSQGAVWIGNGSGQLFSLDHGKVTKILSGGAGDNLFCGTKGRAYFIQDYSGISVVGNGRVRRLPLLPGFTGYGDHYVFLGLAEDPDGGLIAAVGGSAGHGLWRYYGGKWSRFLPDLALPEVCGMLNDGRRGLYLAFTPPVKEIGKVTAGSLESQSLPIGVLGFAHTSYGIVAYGAKGVAVERGKAFQAFSLLHPEYGKMVTGVVEAPGGDLWLMGASGVVRIPAAEVRVAMADPAHSISSVNFQEGDFVGPDASLLFRHSADIDKSGRLWFSTLNGVVSVDADLLGTTRQPPQLSIRDITADGHALRANRTFPADSQYLDINYFGVDLSKPKDVVYRYRLEGLDTTWQNVGSRTEAIYTHLRPGSYRFQVMASNGNDIWTKPVSSTMFRILPRFYDRPWVQGLFVLLGVILVWIVISIRMNYVSSAIRIRAEERAEERVRIARELHDTLLQGVQGLLLSFHVAAEKVQADHESKKALEKALTTADRIILEGRNRVTRLRSENLTDAELKSLIEGVAADLNGFSSANFTIERKGEGKTLRRHVVDEVFCIAREALTNAFRHSGASQIALELNYHKHEFRMTCCDNGRGFDAAPDPASQRNGHWGLRGMAERAKNIGANFSCISAQGKGTEVNVVVPGRRAYVRTSRFRELLGREKAA